MLLLALLPTAMAWGHHTMMSDRALSHEDLA